MQGRFYIKLAEAIYSYCVSHSKAAWDHVEEILEIQKSLGAFDLFIFLKEQCDLFLGETSASRC